MSVVELKIILDDIEPEVTRTLQVPLDIRLDRLHLTVQAAMGWTNSHLYAFIVGGASWGLPDPNFGGEDLPANKTTLCGVVEDTGTKALDYIYDFGDGWEHTLKIGKITEPVPGELYPRLTDVVGTCPPEDVGGMPGYYAFVEAIDDPDHPDHDDLTEWYGESFDPSQPETDSLKLEVLKLAKRWKPKKPRK
ncbi:MAG: plasmid pRiA4b ORF-3 family protein [Alphaproteobacteria bacterium]|nr:plasmid pRiA4b ORF-3 family protein [Alphaproteobacteria bacterium]